MTKLLEWVSERRRSAGRSTGTDRWVVGCTVFVRCANDIENEVPYLLYLKSLGDQLILLMRYPPLPHPWKKPVDR